MKEFSEYKTAVEFFKDAAAEGLIRIKPAGRNYFQIPKLPSECMIKKFQVGILEKIVASPMGKISRSTLYRLHRADNHSDEFGIAIRRLIDEKKIREEKLITGEIGRPCVNYYLYEF